MRQLVLALPLLALLMPGNAMGSDAAADEALENALDKVVQAPGGAPGASALIHRGDEIEFFRAGVANVDSGRLFHRTDHMRIASVSKAFSGAVALSLVDAGALELDDTVGELLPGQSPNWSDITLAQLMQHASGVPTYTENARFNRDLQADPRAHFTPQRLLNYVAGEPLSFPPGAAYEYSNTDNILIGQIVKAVTGNGYKGELRRLVYNPLGMKRTSMPSDPRMPRPFIHGYTVPASGPPEDVSEDFAASFAGAAGAIVSTPLQLNKFIRAYAGGEMFARDVRRAQFDFVPGCGHPPGPGECSGGLSIYRYRTDCGTVFGHTGNLFGYTQFTAATRDGRRSLVVSANEQVHPFINPPAWEPLDAANEAAVCAALR
jgi:D-alanyl-D-alanine carboxypeptidase